MNIIAKLYRFILLILIFTSISGYSQTLSEIKISNKSGLSTEAIWLSDSSEIVLQYARPLFSFLVDGNLYSSIDAGTSNKPGEYSQLFGNGIRVTYKVPVPSASGVRGEIVFENSGLDSVSISNVVPFGEDNKLVYITGRGPLDLARAWLFRPGYRPLRVILPDNAWEMGYSSFSAGKEYSVCAVARRTGVEGGEKKRYETILPPDSRVLYTLYANVFKGEWQNGLRYMFRDKYLFDLDKFDNSMFGREDLEWIRESYLIMFQMAWDREFIDRFTGKYTFAEEILRANELLGKIDVFGIWPTWPRLGLDQRNQWDLYRDLPGGTHQLRNFVELSRNSGTRFFIAYNPWDNSTRKEDHYKGMAQLISEIDADGVVLDTRGNSSYELQAAADSVKKGVVMYSEGMSVPKDMPGIISGRVHNAIYMSPELNLNKLIKPDFSIFRVCDVGEDILHREIAVAFFNGYGTELNMFRPGGRGDSYRQDLNFLGKTTFILRQNSDAFNDMGWTPLIPTAVDDVFVNRWKSGEKTIYTILNMRPEGVRGKLFNVKKSSGRHYVSLWNHENLQTITEGDLNFITVNAEGWHSSLSGTRNEGSVDCIAELPDLIQSGLLGDTIKVKPTGKGKLLVWKGNPAYQTLYKEFRIVSDTMLNVRDLFGYYEGKIVLQLVENERLIDENILIVKGGLPWIVSRVTKTPVADVLPANMILVAGNSLSMNLSPGDDFIPYPDIKGKTVSVGSFLLDKYPVTNAQYYEFVKASGYRPSDTTNYLKHWQSGIFRQGQDKYPVVYVSYEDINAYTKWAQKRLPTEAEWQLAAQGTDERKWPWGNEFHGTHCNNSFGRPTPVDAFAKGESPSGANDMVGNVWQITNDIYFNGTNYFAVIRGGSYYKAESSWWYIKGGPQQLDKTQILLMVSPGFDRSATVGFRCVKDIDMKAFGLIR